MKHSKPLALLALALLVPLAVTGCRKKPQHVTPLPGVTAPAPAPADRPGGPILPGPTLPVETEPRATGPKTSELGVPPAPGDWSKWEPDTDQPFTGDTVYFDFDKSNIRPDQTAKLDKVAAAFKALPGRALRVEGHCDERGTEGYNQALGERRALAIREYLIKSGVDGQLIDTISYGESRPVDPGHNEAAWAKNRRGEFIVLKPKAQ